MKFRLTYEGRLESNGSPKHEHEIRQQLHPQLKRLWKCDPNLREWKSLTAEIFDNSVENALVPHHEAEPRPVAELLAEQYSRDGYRYVPLATERVPLVAALDILFLYPDSPRTTIQSGDIDNRLKTLFGGLKMPQSKEELGGYNVPGSDEDPFYVLLEDDLQIAQVSVETDMLLRPTSAWAGPSDVMLVITVHLKPNFIRIQNLHFA